MTLFTHIVTIPIVFATLDINKRKFLAMPQNTHKAIALIAPHQLGEVEVPTRSPGKGEILIDVDFAAYTAADGHAVDDGFYVNSFPRVLGLVAVGKVLEVGPAVTQFAVGDQVGAYTQPGADGATQKKVIAPQNRVARVPEGVKPEDVAGVIDNFVCAWWTITNSWELPLPQHVPFSGLVETVAVSTPILVWGAGTGSGMYTLQVLKMAGYSNLIATASPRTAHLAFKFGATHVFDYNDPKVAQKILSVSGTSPITHALDPVCTKGSLEGIAKVVTAPGSKVAVLVPIKVGNLVNVSDGGAQLLMELPKNFNPFVMGVDIVHTFTSTWESNPQLKDVLLNEFLPALLEGGYLIPQPIHLVSEGSLLDRVKTAANLIRGNKIRGSKIIVDFRE